MNGIVQTSCAVYARLLPLYPPMLRDRFGREMADTFARQVADGWEEARWAGVAYVWRQVMAEVLCIALPAQLIRPALAVACVSVTGTAVMFVSIFWASQHGRMLTAWYHN